MNRLLFTYSVCLCALFLTSCGSGQPESGAAAPETPQAGEDLDPAKGIDWFEGSVDEAFAAARESGKPIYLYWGAVWCPPCHAISATIFKSPEFIDRSRLFIPVYLDGDTENAQAYGEKFGVLGYPTMIVFNPAGEELTRIPSGIDLQAYANILDLTLDNSSSVSSLVDALTSGEETLAAADCTLLAYYSWGQDTGILVNHDDADVFHRMYSACPAGQDEERSILYLSWLGAALAAAESEEDPVPLTAEQQSEALQKIETVLANEELIKANIVSILLSGAHITNALTEAGSEKRAELTQKFLASYDKLAADDSMYKHMRIYTLQGKLLFERIDDPDAEFSNSLKQEIRDMVTWADETTPSVYERQSIINALGNVLFDAEMDDVARPLLLAELDRSKQPYYFMVTLADIEQRAENYDVAIDWLKRAYDMSKGPATRFEWGSYYLVGLLEMAPTDTQRIHDTTVGLIAELQKGSGFYQRPKRQLQRLEQRLQTWGKDSDNQAAVSEIRDSVLTVCASADSEFESRETCEAFLEAG